MKRKAFTLIELLVVVAILVLLLAIIAPSFSNAFAMARAAICRNNLHKLGQAFSLSSSTRALKDSGQVIGGQSGDVYPEPMSWPSIPRDAVPEEEIYKCPEDEIVASVGGSLAEVEYACEYGKWPLDVVGEYGAYKSRRGTCPQRGPYTEYLLQDDGGHPNGQYIIMSFHGWVDSDGGCRIYDSGVLLSFGNIAQESVGCVPDWSGAYYGYPTVINTCPDQNDILYRGAGAFGGDPKLQTHKGQYWQLPDWGAQTNYGINYYAHEYPFGSGIIVLVDYKEKTIVEVDTPLESEALLLQSARHLGKVNYLKADGSVKVATPQAISPQLHIEKWKP